MRQYLCITVGINITQANSNKTFQIVWPVGAGSSTFSITIPNGFYAVTDLNIYLQEYCISAGLYLINSSGQYVYYCELLTNSNYYSVQFNAYSIPTSLPVGWTQPANLVAYLTVAYTPQLVVPATNFRSIIGFNAGTYPSAQQTTTYSKLGDFVPQVTPVQSVIMNCSLLNNQYSNPRTVLYSFSPAGTTFGSTIQSNPNQFSFIDIQDGNYSDFQISFSDQSFNPLLINDTNLCILLLIKSGSNNSISY